MSENNRFVNSVMASFTTIMTQMTKMFQEQ